MSLDVAPADPVRARDAPPFSGPASFSVDWRDRTCRVELHGLVTARSLDHLSELLQGVGLADGRVLITLVDAVASHEISTELVALSRRLAGDGATLEVRFAAANR